MYCVPRVLRVLSASAAHDAVLVDRAHQACCPSAAAPRAVPLLLLRPVRVMAGASNAQAEYRYRGEYMLTWKAGQDVNKQRLTPDSNMFISFSGFGTIKDALKQCWSPDPCTGRVSASDARQIRRYSFLSLGGGSKPVDPQVLKELSDVNIVAMLKDLQFNGLCFDVETCSTPVQQLLDMFALCKRNGLFVFVTVSHTAPYDCGNLDTQMEFTKQFILNENVDFFSNQMYTQGNDDAFDCTGNVCWNDIAQWLADRRKNAPNSPLAFVPSVSSKAFVERADHRMDGYVMWPME